MTYTLGNKCAKNLCKQTVLLQVIIKNVVICFFWNTVYFTWTYSTQLTNLYSVQVFAARWYASAAYAVMRWCLSVCLCVCLSRLWTLSERINISSFFHSRVATPFSFSRTKHHGNIPTWTPSTGASNAGGVGKNRDLGQYLHRVLWTIWQP